MQIERVAEAHVERAGQAEFLADADRQHAAVREHRDAFDRAAAPGRGELEDVGDALVVKEVAVHRREQADRAQPFIEGALGVLDRVLARRIEHEEADEAIDALWRHRDGDRVGIARQARDQRGLLDAVLVELAHPARAERLDRIGKLPAEAADAIAIGAEAGEETGREEMHVRVVDHRQAFTIVPDFHESTPRTKSRR